MIYLDNGATTYPKPNSVYEALDTANRIYGFNAGRGSYANSKKVADMIESVRSKISSLVHLETDSTIFTSSATESMNMIINGLDFQDGDTVYVSPFEHNAVVRTLYNIKNINIEIIPFDKETWELNHELFKNMCIRNNPKAVFVSHISNVTGYLLPYKEIFDISKKHGAITILDCAQSFGIITPETQNVDFIVFAGHKSLYASFGVAGFINITEIKLNITKAGGTGSDSLNVFMPEEGVLRYEAGSPNSVAIAGLQASLDWLSKNDVYSHEKDLTIYTINQLTKLDNITLYIPKEIDKIFGIISFNIDGISAQDVGNILSDDFDICVRSGFHCAPFVHDFLSTRDIGGTVRIGLGAFNCYNDIDSLINALKEVNN